MGKIEEHSEKLKQYSPEILKHLRNTRYRHENSVFFYTVGYAKGYKESYKNVSDVLESNDFPKVVKSICEKLLEEYPHISTYKGIFDGQPHIKGTRFRVSDVLSAFCIYDSIEEVIDNLENRYSKDQLKSALRFARDFLDTCHTLPES